MRKIAILYMCTGPYIGFWKAFLDSFEEKFLRETEKHYYVYTDNNKIYMEENPRVHKCFLAAEPWPLPTLLKFHYFLKLESELIEYDYIYHSNANIICAEEVKEQEFLPQPEKGQTLIFTMHPGYFNRKKYDFPYERNDCSKAYIPYNVGKDYVFGAMNGGLAIDYIRFMKNINGGIVEDLKKGIIARWHDESHVNHYVVMHNDYKILDQGYCYPVGFEVPYEKKIAGVSKMDVFDVNQFKGYYQVPKYSLGEKVCQKISGFTINRVMPVLCYGRDVILCRKPME